MSKFDSEFYSRFRPFYPAALFAPLVPALERLGFAAPFALADIGCGTGHSTLSLLRSGISARVTGVDPDPAMLAKAREICPAARFVTGSGEATGLSPGAYDAVTVGSAFHWMDDRAAAAEFVRILKPSGIILIYEYQFPKALAHPALNEWIRREFNLRWKAPQQRPRGDFSAVTGLFRSDRRFLALGDFKVPMLQELGPKELTGLILSQSRVLHYEAGMTPDALMSFRGTLAAEIERQFDGRADLFDFNLQAALFALSA